MLTTEGQAPFLVFDEINAQIERARLEEVKEQALAEKVAATLLTEAWRRSIGPAWVLVSALIQELATARATHNPTAEHAFGRLEDIAALVRAKGFVCSERSLQRWLSPTYEGAAFLKVWLSRRTWYMTRTDGLPCRGGTVFRVRLEGASLDAPIPLGGVRPTALQTVWRTQDDLPLEKTQQQADSLFESNTRQLAVDSKTFPKKTGNENRVSIESTFLSINISTVGNTRQPENDGNARLRAMRLAALESGAGRAATAVVNKLGDQGNWAFWYGQFKALSAANKSNTHVFAAVSNALEHKANGKIRSSAAAYAVGVLKRMNGAAPSTSRPLDFGRA